MNLKGWIALIVVAIIAIGGWFTPMGKSLLGAVGSWTNYYGVSVAQFRVGSGCDDEFGTCTGTSLEGIVTGACTIWTPATTIAASTTQQAVCQSATDGSLTSGLTGVTADSVCSVRMASSTNTTSNGLVVGGTSASSTAGSIVVQVSNLTGTTYTWTATASSSAQWKYSCFNPV